MVHFDFIEFKQTFNEKFRTSHLYCYIREDFIKYLNNGKHYTYSHKLFLGIAIYNFHLLYKIRAIFVRVLHLTNVNSLFLCSFLIRKIDFNIYNALGYVKSL